MDDRYCVESSEGIIEGNKIIITQGPFIGRESLIKNIDRHKRQGVAELRFMGEKMKDTVGVKITERRP